jgi:hypothetical protein
MIIFLKVLLPVNPLPPQSTRSCVQQLNHNMLLAYFFYLEKIKGLFENLAVFVSSQIPESQTNGARRDGQYNTM